MKLAPLFLVVTLTGCNSYASPSGTELESVDAKDVLRRSPVSFMSWNGEWQGTDIDTTLAFLPDGRVQITHYGSGVDSVSGTYKTDGDTITIDAPWKRLVEMPGSDDFPALKLTRESDLYYLFPAIETQSLQYGASSGWPFKQTNADDVKQPPSDAG